MCNEHDGHKLVGKQLVCKLGTATCKLAADIIRKTQACLTSLDHACQASLHIACHKLGFVGCLNNLDASLFFFQRVHVSLYD